MRQQEEISEAKSTPKVPDHERPVVSSSSSSPRQMAFSSLMPVTMPENLLQNKPTSSGLKLKMPASKTMTAPITQSRSTEKEGEQKQPVSSPSNLVASIDSNVGGGDVPAVGEGWSNDDEDDMVDDIDATNEVQTVPSAVPSTENGTHKKDCAEAVTGDGAGNKGESINGDLVTKVDSKAEQKEILQNDVGEKDPSADASPKAGVSPQIAEEKTSPMIDCPEQQQIEQNISGEESTDSSPNDSSSLTTAKQAAVPDDIMEQFSSQLQRLEENHQIERSDMERSHAAEIEKMRASLDRASLAKAREMEKQLMAEIKERDEQIRRLTQANEGYRLDAAFLKGEVKTAQQSLEAKESDLGKTGEAHSQALKNLEGKFRNVETKERDSRQEAEKLRELLETANGDLAASRKEYTDLKARVKMVAGELKDRRVECRKLTSEVGELTEQNEALQSHLEDLQSKIHVQDRSQSEKHEEAEEFKTKLNEANSEREKLLKELADKEAKNTKSLAEYKKKAQSSLALANSRTAAAVQAREEAELEARAARSTSDTAMERAVKAEVASKEALAEAKVYVKDMEREKAQVTRDFEEAKNALQLSEDRFVKSQEQYEMCLSAKNNLSDQLKKVLSEVEAEKMKVSELKSDLSNKSLHENTLQEEISTLQDQLQATEAVIASKAENATKDEEVPVVPVENLPVKPSDDATIISLQHELREAKEDVEELKEALRNALEANPPRDETDPSHEPDQSSANESSSENGSMPLFFAMEKQQELKTARNEIQRLANLLADVQSDKMEAHEAMEGMRKQMEDAEARLQRFEKLSSIPGRSSSAVDHEANASSVAQDSQVNIEYLKNIMLKYLSATTVGERKLLLPAISAVLCLTVDEQKLAMKSLDESGSLGGVGSSLFESLSGMYPT